MSSSNQERKKRWQVHEGKNTICLDGRLIMARDSSVFYLTVALIIVPSVLFFALDCPYLVSQLNAAVPVFGGLLLIVVMGCLLRTSLSDPGILPRATPQEAAFAEAQMAHEREAALAASENGNSAVPWTVPAARQVLIHGKPVELKYCSTCKFFRPPRASHCSTCDNCIEIFDHHCPWVGNCVGRRNYKYFYMFNVTLSVYGLYLLAFASTALALRLLSGSSVADAFKSSWQSVAEIVVSLFGFFFVAGLSCYHTHLICNDVSTREKLKEEYSQPGKENPFSHASAITRFGYSLCRAPYPSSLNFEKEQVLPEDEAALVQEIIVKYNLGRAGASKSTALNTRGPMNSPTFAAGASQIELTVQNEVRVQALYHSPLSDMTTRQSSANSRVRVEII